MLEYVTYFFIMYKVIKDNLLSLKDFKLIIEIKHKTH